MIHRHMNDCREYLAERMPAKSPQWLMDRMAELLFRYPEWRLAEVADLIAGQAVNFVLMDECHSIEPSISFATTATFDKVPIQADEHGLYAFWHNDNESIQCFGPLNETLLLGADLPFTSGEPHRIPMLNLADPNRTLIEQQQELLHAVRPNDAPQLIPVMHRLGIEGTGRDAFQKAILRTMLGASNEELEPEFEKGLELIDALPEDQRLAAYDYILALQEANRERRG